MPRTPTTEQQDRSRRELLKKMCASGLVLGGLTNIQSVSAKDNVRENDTDLELAILLEEVYARIEKEVTNSGQYQISSLDEIDTGTYNHRDEEISTEIPNIPGIPPLPTSLPFGFCVDPPFTDEVCSTFSNPVSNSVSCAPYSNINKVGFEIAQGPSLEVEDGDINGSIEWSTFGWVGFSSYCVYVGQSIGDYELWCEPIGCQAWPSPTSVPDVADAVTSVAWDVVDLIDDQLNLPNIIEIVLVIVVAAAIAILIIKPPTGIPA